MQNDKIKKDVEELVEVPVEAVKTAVEVEKEGVKVIGSAAKALVSLPYKKRRSILDFFWRSKRGVITGAADNDPAGIVTYTQAGAIGGYRLLWLIVLAWPLLIAIEEMSARIGIVTKLGINQIITKHYGRSLAILAALIVFICNTFTIGADIAAMSDVASIATGISQIFFIVIFGGLFFYLLWKKGYQTISRYLFLLTPIFLLYIISAFLFDVPWGQALKETFWPQINEIKNMNLTMVAVAILGTILSPYLIYWESAQEIEENKEVSQLKNEQKGVTFGMFFTQVVAFFIIVAAADAFFGHNQVLETAKDAAMALKPMGNVSFLLFTIGILGSGLLAIPILSATTGYTVSETFGWKKGLDNNSSKAKGFYIVMIASLIIGLVIALMKFNPILMLLYSQILNGFLMPILVLILLLVTNNKKIMGKYTNKLFTNFFGILALIVLIIFDISMIIEWIR